MIQITAIVICFISSAWNWNSASMIRDKSPIMSTVSACMAGLCLAGALINLVDYAVKSLHP